MKRLLFLTAAVLLPLFLSSCGSESSSTPGFTPGSFRGGQAVSVEVAPVQTGTISEQVRSFGTVRAQDVVSITPQVSNRVTKIHVDLGDQVSTGQVLAEIYDVPFRDAAEQAQAQIRQARANLDRDSTQMSRQRELYERDLISGSEFDNARAAWLSSLAQYESARAALTQSRENLENAKVKSPVNGVVLNRLVAEGDVASAGQPMFEVANLVGFETRVFLPLQDWELVQVGQDVSMALSSRAGEIAKGVVSRKSAQLNPTTGLGEVVVTLTETVTSIYQGALVQARINLQTRENAIVIPRSAMVEKVDTYIEPETGTIELERKYSVFVSQGDTVAVNRELTLGIQQGDNIEILEGLAPGDRLIVTGHRNLQNNSRIRVAGSEPRQTPAGMSPEQLRQMRENMTPEQIQQMREQRARQGGGQGGRRPGSN